MGKTLGIILSGYPYGRGEVFFEDELKVLSEHFDRIVLFVPVLVPENENAKPIVEFPENVVFVPVKYQYSFFSRLRSFFGHGPLTLFNIIRSEFRKDHFSLAKLKILISYLSKERDLRKSLEKKMNEFGFRDQSFSIYTYWFTEYTYALFRLIRRFPLLKTYTRLHGWDLYCERHEPPYLPLRKRVIEGMTGCFTISQDGREYLISKMGILPDKITTSRLGVKPLDNRIYVHEKGVINILSLSFIRPVKHLELLIEGLAGWDSSIKINWYHIGGGPNTYANNVRNLAKDLLGSKDNVSYNFIGTLTPEEIKTYLSTHSIDLMFNVSHSEGIPVSMMEAMSAGIPVVGPNVGGISEMILHGRNGFLMSDSPTPDEIKKVIANYSNLSLAEIEKLREQALTTWRDEFNAETNYNEFARILGGIKKQTSTVGYKSKVLDITPSWATRLTGMTFDERHDGVHSNLQINAMMLDQQDKQVIIISIDTLFITLELKQFIVEEVRKYFGPIPESDILTMSTHTHFAPTLEEKRIDLGVKDEDYFSFLKEKISELVRLLHTEPYTDVEIFVAQGKSTNLTSNRRRRVRTPQNYFKSFISMEPNLRGFKNEEYKIVTFYDSINKKTVGSIWSFPCHPTNFFDSKKISAEFPGLIRDSIRKKENSSEISIVYMPGFAGNVRAYPPKRATFLRSVRNLLQLSYPLKYYKFVNEFEYNKWANSVKENFWRILDQSEPLNLHGTALQSQISKKATSAFGITVEGIDHLVFRKANLGSEFGIYTISAEPVSEYYPMLSRIAKERFYICTGYTDEVFGYLPTNKQIGEGGYECQDSFHSFLISGDFNSSIENTIESCIREINSKS